MMRAEKKKQSAFRAVSGRGLRTLLTVMLLVFAVVCVVKQPGQRVYAEETGVEETVTTPTITPVKPDKTRVIGEKTYYEIDTAAELYWFACLVNGDTTVCDGTEIVQDKSACAVLTADITINDVTFCDAEGNLLLSEDELAKLIPWTPVGNADYVGDYGNSGNSKYFNGCFDGQGYSISGLYYPGGASDEVGGLFGLVKGTIKRVSLVNSYLKAAGICGYLYSGNILNCYSDVLTTNNVGICGNLCYGTISNCYSKRGFVAKNAGNGYDGLIATAEYCIGGVSGMANAEGSYAFLCCFSANELKTIGEKTYVLNGKVSAEQKDENIEFYWYQRIGEDEEPKLINEGNKSEAENGKIYISALCPNNPNWIYTNELRETAHEYTNCNGYLCGHCYDINPGKMEGLIDTTTNTWLIDTAEELYAFAEYYNNYSCYTDLEDTESDAPKYVNVRLTDNIDLNPDMSGVDLTSLEYGTGNLIEEDGTLVDTMEWKVWPSIGNRPSRAYVGTFDGNEKIISHLYGEGALIQFGSRNVTVTNLGLRDSYINSKWARTASILGNEAGSVTNCFSNCIIIALSLDVPVQDTVNGYATGGISSISGIGTVSNCYFNGKIMCYYLLDGIYAVGPSATNCFSTISTAEPKTYSKWDSETKLVTQEQVANGDLAHLLQVATDADTWSQGAGGYPVPTGNGEGVTHQYNQKTGVCFCGATPWDNNLVDVVEPTKNDDGAYEIKTVGHLFWFAGLVNGDARVCDGITVKKTRNANAVLMNDIVVSEASVLNETGDGLNVEATDLIIWTPIGIDQSNAYTGTFDGQGYTISGLVHPYTDVEYAGLFGYVTGTIENLAVTNSCIFGDRYVGGICGYTTGAISKAAVTNSYIYGGADTSQVGGLCGHSTQKITACYSDALVEGNSEVDSQRLGGLCGYVGQIYNSYYAGKSSKAIDLGSTVMYCASTAELGGNNRYYCLQNLATVPSSAHSSASSEYVLHTKNPATSGELVYLLNGKMSAEAATETAPLYWYQDLSQADSIPVLQASENGKVYALQACPDATTLVFSNSSEALDHKYSDGYVCDYCYKINDDADFIIDGTTWEINDAAGLYAFNKYMNNYLSYGEDRTLTAINVVLKADIDLNPGMDLTLDETTKTLANTTGLTNWTPIGTSSNLYAGTFDGQGHVIKHLYINEKTGYKGLFGYCKTDAVIQNTGIIDSYIYTTSLNVGSFSGNSGTVTNCFSNAVINGYNYLSGISYNGTVSNCYFAGQIYASYPSATYFYCIGSKRENCYSTKEIYRGSSWNKVPVNDNLTTTITEDQITSGALAHLLQVTAGGAEAWSQRTIDDKSYAVPMGGTVISHSFVDGTCACGATAKVAGYTLSLGDLIGINFKFEFSEVEATDVSVKFIMPDGGMSEFMSFGEADKDGYYTASCYVAAKEMKDDVTVILYDAAENELLRNTTSVSMYANKILQDTTNEMYTSAQQALVEKMLDYGAYAKQYFAKSTDTALDGVGLDTVENVVNNLSTNNLDKPVEAETDFIRYAGCSLILLSDTTLRVYFEPVGQNAPGLGAVNFTCNSETLYKGTYQKGGKTYYYADVTGIKPDSLDALRTITVTSGASTYEVTLSPMFYVKDMLAGKTSDTMLIDLLRALYAYHIQARSYQQQ